MPRTWLADVSRLAALHALLAAGGRYSAAELADRLSQSERTVHRSLVGLRKLGAPLEVELVGERRTGRLHYYSRRWSLGAALEGLGTAK